MVNLSATGVAVECPEPVTPSSTLVVIAPALEVTALAQVRHCVWVRSQYRFGLQFLTSPQPNSTEVARTTGCHELLSAGIAGETQSFEALYRTLAFRYHPDNQDTGNPEAFLQIREIYRILSSGQSPRGNTSSETKSEAPTEEQGSALAVRLPGRKRHLAVLRLLYERRLRDCHNAGVSQCDIETVTGLPGNEVHFILWYLREKGAITAGDSLSYAISAAGVDLFDEVSAA